MLLDRVVLYKTGQDLTGLENTRKGRGTGLDMTQRQFNYKKLRKSMLMLKNNLH
jgi:hypothetical protein